jgi:hypothetical protein
MADIGHEAEGRKPAHRRGRCRLETIREFAFERLEETGDAEDLRHHRHSVYFLDIGEVAKPELHGPTSSIWPDRLEAEHDNIRGARLGAGSGPPPHR